MISQHARDRTRMRLFGWLKRESRATREPGREQWRRDWEAAAADPSIDDVRNLGQRLQHLHLDDDDVEVEREMLEALERAVALKTSVDAHGLPAIETGHRIAGTDSCHFSAPASMPDEDAQPGGRLLLTSARAAFAAGGASRRIPWHALAEARHQARDILLVRGDRAAAYRFRCNSYGDALCGAYIARQLITARGTQASRV